MAIDPHYIPAFSIEDVLLDKDTGAPLSGGLVYFEEDNNRGVLKPVYQITGTSPDYTYTQLPNPMILSSIGTFEDSLANPVVPYFFPFVVNAEDEFIEDYYYVRVTNSMGVPQFDRQAVPYIPDGSLNPVVTDQSFTNQLANPQFSEVLFNTSTSSFTFNLTGALIVTPIGPHWDLITTGTGTVIVSQVTPTGSLNIPTNPGTILSVNVSSGFTVAQLRQRIFGSPNIFGSGNISTTLVAAALSSGAPVISMFYSQSNGLVVDQQLLTETLDQTNGYLEFFGVPAVIPASTSTATFPSAYVDIFINLPVGSIVGLTSIQIVYTGQDIVPMVPYDETTNARQIDYLFDYYQPQLNFKPIPSYLVGWNFPLNPCQELGKTVSSLSTSPGKSRYVADQTIAYQDVDNTLSFVFQNPAGCTVAASATTQWALIQYIPLPNSRDAVNSPLCMQLTGYLGSSTASDTITGTVSLYTTTDGSVPNINVGTGNSLVASMTNGIPVSFNGNWTEIPNTNLNTSFILETSTVAGEQTFSFTGWPPVGGNVNYLAIVISFTAMPATQGVALRSVTLNNGYIPTSPAPQSFDEVLRQCEHYYEKSYDNNVIPGTTNSLSSCLIAQQVLGASVGNTTVLPGVFGSTFSVSKRSTNPTMTFYSPISGSAGNVLAELYNGSVLGSGADALVANFWTAVSHGNKAFEYIPSTLAPIYAPALGTGNIGFIYYQFVSDARLGIV